MAPRFGERAHSPHPTEFSDLVERPQDCAPTLVINATATDTDANTARPDSVVEVPEAVAPARSLKKKAVLHESEDMTAVSSSSTSSIQPSSAVLETSNAVPNPVTTPPIEIDPAAAKDIATAVEKAPATGSTQLYHIKTSFKPHLMKPNTRMKAQDCYGIAVQKNEAETTVSMYHCPAVKGTCPSSLSDKCTLTEITRIPTSIDLSKNVEETLLMRY